MQNEIHQQALDRHALRGYDVFVMVEAQRSRPEIVVMTGGSFEPALDHVATAFKESTGHKVTVSYSHDLESADVVVLSEEALERSYRHSGRIERGEIYVASTPGIGVAVRRGTKLPRVSDAKALFRSLLDADHILMSNRHASSLYLESVFREHGIYENLQSRIRTEPIAQRVIERLLAGKGNEVLLLPVNAIKASRDQRLLYVGPLPDEIQKVSRFFAAPMVSSTNKQAAWEFARFCAGAARPILLAHGFS